MSSIFNYFVVVALAMTTSISLAAPATKPAPATTAWHDVHECGVEGKGFTDTESYFDRLPARAEKVVPQPVWDLSRDSTGMAAQFETDSPSIWIRYSLLSANLAMAHMPATGVSGVDLYGKLDGQWRWVAVAKPSSKEVETELTEGLKPGMREYVIYLPLYNGVTKMEIGVEKNAKFKPIAPRSAKPIVYYGTSIAQGACASRPGMAFTNILSRRLDRPFINLAFSGVGKMDAAVAKFVAEIDAAVYVIDCLPNMTTEQVTERVKPLTDILRKAHPETPIVFVEDRTFGNAEFHPKIQEQHVHRRAALRREYDTLTKSGVKNLYYIEGAALLGSDGEATTDGSHPNDLGMMRYADVLEPRLREMLAK